MVKKDSATIHYVIFILCIIAVPLLVLLFLHVGRATPSQPILYDGSLHIPISIADTEQSRDQGLSGTVSLPTNTGKLFMFDTPGSYGFWMKDMNYPLDLVWIDSSMNIIAITPNVAADTYPQIFYPPSPVQEVLEVNAHFSSQHDLLVGQHLTLQKHFD